jgi:hypothetical protein
MNRFVAVILFLLLLPRIVLAVPGADVICFSSDHVASGCHDSPSDPPCDSGDANHPAQEPSGGECIDVAAPSVDARSGNTKLPALELQALADVLCTELCGLIASTRADPASSVSPDTPPRFSARLFATFISPRC